MSLARSLSLSPAHRAPFVNTVSSRSNYYQRFRKQICAARNNRLSAAYRALITNRYIRSATNTIAKMNRPDCAYLTLFMISLPALLRMHVCRKSSEIFNRSWQFFRKSVSTVWLPNVFGHCSMPVRSMVSSISSR